MISRKVANIIKKGLNMSKLFSTGGYTFFSTYFFCQRKFYFSYILRYEPEGKNQKMALGQVIHATIKDFLKNSSLMLDVYDKHVIAEQLTDPNLINTGYRMIEAWLYRYGNSDRFKYTSVILDEVIEIPIEIDRTGEKFIYVWKPDRVMYDTIADRNIIFETKTTTYNAKRVLEGFMRSGQATAYIWAYGKWMQQRGMLQKLVWVVPEVICGLKTKVNILRETEIMKTRKDLQRFEQALKHVITTINIYQSTESLYIPNIDCDSKSFCTCDFYPICHIQGLEPGHPPCRFKTKEEWDAKK
jgi:hypothetical protein